MDSNISMNRNANPLAEPVPAPAVICEQQETVGFVDSSVDIKTEVKGYTDPTVLQSDSTSATLANFFRRPVEIYSSDGLGQSTLKPWHLWANNNYVKDKLNNFALFRGRLMIKVVVNGAPFLAGRSILSYEPLFDLSTTSALTLTTGYPANFAQMETINMMSQKPNIRIDITDSQGGCMCLPFIWRDNFIEVTDASAWTDLGALILTPISAIDGTDATSGTIGITIYAWCEDVELHIPTVYTALSQAGGDEYESVENTGVISGAANTVAMVSNILKQVPFIAPFAKATEIGATAVSKIAQIFGFSRPSDVSNVKRMRNEPAGILAWTEGTDEAIKLTLDPKQELTIDPRTVGLDVGDELTIANIAEKWAIFSAFQWKTDTAVNATLLTSAVHPVLGTYEASANEAKFRPTPVAFASIPFKFWSGTLIFRFEIIANKFTRGRLLLSWDPLSKTNAETADATNIMYSHIMDLADKRTFEVAIPWGVASAYRQVADQFATPKFTNPVDGAPTITDSWLADYANGVFSVSVLNKLSTSGDTATVANVDCYVSVRAGEDFELRAPASENMHNISYFAYTESSDDEIVGNVENLADSEPISIIPRPLSKMELKSSVFFGDPVVSFRSLLKRYNYYMLHWVKQNLATGSVCVNSWSLPDFPAYYGYDPLAEWLYTTPVPDVPFQPAFTTLIHYLTPAFVGWRGSLRHKYVMYNVNKDAQITDFTINRNQNTSAVDYYSNDTRITSALPDNANCTIGDYYGLTNNCIDGSHVIQTGGQKNFNVEFPFYSNKRFHLAKDLTRLSTIDGEPSAFHNLRFLMRQSGTANTTADTVFGFKNYLAAGEDFNLFFFVNAPMQHNYTASRVSPITPPVST